MAASVVSAIALTIFILAAAASPLTGAGRSSQPDQPQGGLMGVGTSIVLIAAGAILDFAVKVQTTGFNINTIGLILMIVGAVGLVLSLVFWGSWGGVHRGDYRRTRRVVHDGANTYVEEEGRY